MHLSQKNSKDQNKSFLGFAVLAGMLLSFAALPAMAAPPGWVIIKLADNCRSSPQISGSNVVWSGYDGNDTEIFLYNGSTGTTTQLTNNTYDDSSPAIDGSNVVWAGYDGNDTEIFLYNDSTGTTTELTNNSYCDEYPQISGSNVVWQSYDSNDSSIFFSDGSIITQLTNDSYFGNGPAISGSNIVWSARYDGSPAIFLYNSSTGTTTQLANNAGIEPPQISDSNVVWSGYDGNDYEIFFYNSSTATTTQLTNNSYDDGRPDISGSNVTWVSRQGYSSQIFFYNGFTITQLTYNNSWKNSPQISGSNVVWSDYYGHDVFLYDGTKIIQFINNNIPDDSQASIQISGSNIVWVFSHPIVVSGSGKGVGGNVDELFMATKWPAGRFGSLGDVKNAKATVNISDGNDVTFSLTGGGHGQIDPCDPNFSTITLYETTDKSVLTISIKGNAKTSFGSICCGGPLKAISAKNVTVHGTITIGSSSNPKAAITITFDEANDLTIDSTMPIKSISATRWLGGSIIAPSLDSITTKGDRKRAIPGNLDIDVTSGGVIKTVKVAGRLSGSWDCNIVKSITAADMNEFDLSLSKQPDAKVPALGKLTVKNWITSSQIQSTGNIGAISTGGIADSICFAGVADTNDSDGDDVLDLPDPNHDINYAQPATIKSITIKGIKGQLYGMINSSIAAAQILTAYLAYPAIDNNDIPFGLSAGFIKSLKFKDIQGTPPAKNLDVQADSLRITDAEIRLY